MNRTPYMNRASNCFFCVLMLFCHSSALADSRFGFLFGLNYDNIELDDAVLFDGITRNTFDLYGVDMAIHYFPTDRLKLSAGFSIGENVDDLFGTLDDLYFLRRYLTVAPSFTVGESLVINPELGFTAWSLKLEEGALLNPGAEGSRKLSGHDYFAGLQAKWRSFYAKYRLFNGDFGDASSVSIGADIEF